MEKEMEKEIGYFQKIAEALLSTHYGLSLNDTRLCESEYVEALVKAGIRPYETLNEHAEDCDLERIDLQGAYGVPSKQPLTAEDEDRAIEKLNRSNEAEG